MGEWGGGIALISLPINANAFLFLETQIKPLDTVLISLSLGQDCL